MWEGPEVDALACCLTMRQVAVPLPDLKGRQDILEYYLHDKPVSALVDRDLLARQTQGREQGAAWRSGSICQPASKRHSSPPRHSPRPQTSHHPLSISLSLSVSLALFHARDFCTAERLLPPRRLRF